MKSKGIAIPYVVWMAVFVVAPLIVVVVYAFTNRDWTVTLDHFNTLGQYAGVFGAPSCWPLWPPLCASWWGTPWPTFWPESGAG